MGWPDVVIAFALGLGVLGGWWRGLVGEVMSLAAWVVSISAGFLYRGQFDHDMMARFHVGPGPAHAFGMAAFGAIGYAVVFGAGFALRRVARLPVIRSFDRLGGAAFGGGKTLLLLWAALYVALFFPLPSDLRTGLHHSPLVAVLALPNEAIDTRVRDALPGIVRPYAGAMFAGHHV